ncbi:MAG: permease [Candidatus Woesearchaeota archaeon]
MKRIYFGIIIIALLLGGLVSYEWYSSFKKSKLIEKGIYPKEPFPISSETPKYLIPIYTLLSYAQKAWVCLLIAFLVAGAFQAFIPKELVIKRLSGNDFKSYLIAAFGGPMLSVCSCSIIPLFAAIKKRGAGLGPAITFLLATPAINPAAVILTISLLSWKVALARIILAITAAMLTGLMINKLFGKQDHESSQKLKIDYHEQNFSFKRDIKEWFLNVYEFTAKILPLVFLGIFIIGIVKIFLKTEIISKYLGQGIPQTALASIIGVIMYTPTLVEIPFVSELLILGMGTAPAIAFLLTGPALSLPSLLGVSRVVKWKIVLTYAMLMFVFGVIGGLLFAHFVPQITLV